ncbi:MAG: hypothetical protein AAGK21_10865 [Bacteroidota bacterium]
MRGMLLFFALAVAAAGCDSSALPSPPAEPVPRGDRVLALDVVEAVGEDFDGAVEIALDLGARHGSLSQGWAGLETAPGQFRPEPNFLEIANAYYPVKGVPIALTIASVDTNVDQRPDDLRDLDWDDPVLAARYRGLLDWAVTQTRDLDVTHVVVGNEVDIFFGSDRDGLRDYRRFVTAVVDHARQLWPGATVGTKVSYGGVTGPLASDVAALQALGDAALITYYPLTDGFQVQRPQIVSTHLRDMADRFPEVHLMEAGYPSSSATGGDEDAQATFVRELFAAWDANATAIPYLSFSFLTDFSADALDGFEAYYGISDPAFIGYLASLGLRTSGGDEKAAFSAFEAAASSRGW